MSMDAVYIQCPFCERAIDVTAENLVDPGVRGDGSLLAAEASGSAAETLKTHLRESHSGSVPL